MCTVYCVCLCSFFAYYWVCGGVGEGRGILWCIVKKVKLVYCRMVFDYKYLLITNCEFFLCLQLIDSQTYMCVL